MSEPTTEAGKRLLSNEWLVTPYGEAWDSMARAVCAIEDEAREQWDSEHRTLSAEHVHIAVAEALTAAAARVEALIKPGISDAFDGGWNLAIRAIIAAITPEASE